MLRWSEHVRGRLAGLNISPAREAEIIEELSQHLEERYAELRNGGMTDEEAQRVALDELLDEQALSNHLRPLRQAHTPPPIATGATGGSLVMDLSHDVRHSLRSLRNQPIFAAAAVLTLALGLGATTAIFSVVNAVLIKPLPYPEPDSLVRIVHSIGGIRQQFFSEQIYLAYASNTQAFEDLGVWTAGSTATISGQGEPEEVRALRASRGVLTTLGVRPVMGRWFSPSEDTRGALDVVMVTAGYWQRRLGRDPGVLSRTMTIDGRPHQIIGVMPADFRFSRDFDVVLPLRVNTESPGRAFTLLGVARLKPGVTMTQANADVSRIIDIWFAMSGGNPTVRARWAPALYTLKQDVIGDIANTLWVLMGAIAIVLVMACANVANLLLVRAETRRQELAIRAAFGAGVARVARQLLVESLTIALLGGAVGVAIAHAALRALVAIGPANLPRVSEIAIDPVVLGFALTISVASGMLFGLIPIVKHARPRMSDAFAGGRSGGLTRERQRSQQALVAAQLALTLVLLVSAGLMIRSFQALRSVDPGFTEPEHIQTFSISIPSTMVAEPERVTHTQQQVLENIKAIPGVASVAFMTRVPMGGPRSSAALLVDGMAVDAAQTPPNRHVKVVSPGAFDTLGTPIVAGRDFTWADIHATRNVAIVSENLARELASAAGAAIGIRFREYYDDEAPWWEIIGVAADVYDDGVHQPAPQTVYWPALSQQRLMGMAGFQARRVSVAVRTERAGTVSLLNQLHEAVWAVNPTLPLAQMSTLDDVYRQSMARTSFTLVMLAIAGTMALLLGVAGLYGVVSYAVSQRRREIGIRLALGARPAEIRGLFVRRGLVLGSVGVALGLVSAAIAMGLMRSLLFGVEPLDPVTFSAMAAVLAAVALLASYVPARRAMAVDPVETMRAE
jgi:predicted permease